MYTKPRNPDGRPSIDFNQELINKVLEYYDLTKRYIFTVKFVNYYHKDLLPDNKPITVYLVKQIIRRNYMNQ